MAAAAGGEMASLVSELLGCEAVSTGLFEEERVDLFEFVPVAGGR
jgi:hypothetical protein